MFLLVGSVGSMVGTMPLKVGLEICGIKAFCALMHCGIFSWVFILMCVEFSLTVGFKVAKVTPKEPCINMASIDMPNHMVFTFACK